MSDSVLTQLAKMDIERMKRYKELLDFYNGRQWEGRERRGERRLVFNYARVFVEKITAYLMTGINFAVEPYDDTDAARVAARKAEAAIYEVYADNQLEQLDLDTEIDGAVLGDACYKVTWDPAEKKVRVTAPDIQGIYAWLSSPAGVWRADRTERRLDLTADVTGVRQESDATSGSLLVELRNDDGRYAAPGQGDLAALDIGCRLEFSPGYQTPSGDEFSQGPGFYIESFEHTSAGGRSSLLVQAWDGSGALEEWQARQQFRWNQTSDDYSVKDIIAVVLARVGLNLEVVSASDTVTGFFPISRSTRATAAVRSSPSCSPSCPTSFSSRGIRPILSIHRPPIPLSIAMGANTVFGKDITGPVLWRPTGCR